MQTIKETVYEQTLTMQITILCKSCTKLVCTNMDRFQHTYKGMLVSCKSCSKGGGNHSHQLKKFFINRKIKIIVTKLVGNLANKVDQKRYQETHQWRLRVANLLTQLSLLFYCSQVTPLWERQRNLFAKLNLLLFMSNSCLALSPTRFLVANPLTLILMPFYRAARSLSRGLYGHGMITEAWGLGWRDYNAWQ